MCGETVSNGGSSFFGVYVCVCGRGVSLYSLPISTNLLLAVKRWITIVFNAFWKKSMCLKIVIIVNVMIMKFVMRCVKAETHFAM